MADQPSIEWAVGWGGDTWREQVERGLEWLGPLVGLKVLDLGTRTGEMAIFLAQRGAQVTGLDVNPAPLTQAQETSRRLGLESAVQFDVYSGAVRDLPRDFDVVFTKSTLVLFQDIEDLAFGIASALRPRGRLVAIENARGPWPVHLARMAYRRSLRPYGASYFTPKGVSSFARQLDLELVHWTKAPPTVLICGHRR